jgi:AraC family transcriptional activator of mtrCDE
VLLEDLLNNFAVTADPFARCVVSTGFELRLPGLAEVTLHFVIRGEGELQVVGSPSLPIAAYTLAMVPSGRRHAIRGPIADPRQVVEGEGDRDPAGLLEFVAGPDGDRDLEVACGHLEAVYADRVRLFGLLDEPLVLDFRGSAAMRHTFERILDESADPGPGTGTMLAALMSECLVLVFRRLSRSTECTLPWLLALDDPRFARVVDAVVAHPEDPHSVDSLAALARMSRSAFALAFTSAFHQGPMTFVREVRLRRGARYLRTTDLPVDAIARRVGFASRSQFTRAFHKHFGMPPADFRQHEPGAPHARPHGPTSALGGG